MFKKKKIVLISLPNVGFYGPIKNKHAYIYIYTHTRVRRVRLKL